MSQSATTLIQQACRSQSARPVTSEELSSVQLLGSDSDKDGLSGKLYNGLTDTSLTELTIAVTTKIRGKPVTKTYAALVDVAPLTIGGFEITIVPGDPLPVPQIPPEPTPSPDEPAGYLERLSQSLGQAERDVAREAANAPRPVYSAKLIGARGIKVYAHP